MALPGNAAYPLSLAKIKEKHPLLHCISNIVTANDCANLALAVGASPMMAQAPEEMADIASIADAIVINTGTPSTEKYAACLASAKAAAELGKPVVYDLVGIGTNAWRLAHCVELLKVRHERCILRINFREAMACLNADLKERGVDGAYDPAGADLTPSEAAQRVSAKYGVTVLLSGTDDIIADGDRVRTVSGGSDMMRSITGAGCMLSVLCGAFMTAEEDPFSAALQASVFWKVCAAAAEKNASGRGLGSFHTALLDAASIL